MVTVKTSLAMESISLGKYQKDPISCEECPTKINIEEPADPSHGANEGAMVGAEAVADGEENATKRLEGISTIASEPVPVADKRTEALVAENVENATEMEEEGYPEEIVTIM